MFERRVGGGGETKGIEDLRGAFLPLEPTRPGALNNLQRDKDTAQTRTQ